MLDLQNAPCSAPSAPSCSKGPDTQTPRHTRQCRRRKGRRETAENTEKEGVKKGQPPTHSTHTPGPNLPLKKLSGSAHAATLTGARPPSLLSTPQCTILSLFFCFSVFLFVDACGKPSKRALKERAHMTRGGKTKTQGRNDTEPEADVKKGKTSVKR